MQLNDLLGKTCLIGLSYFDTNQALLKQMQHAGQVVTVDAEEGIGIELHKKEQKDQDSNKQAPKHKTEKPPIFTLPSSLAAWFSAPAGTYRDETGILLIQDPDYFVTWDIHKTKDDTQEGQHEWWRWVPRTVAPSVNAK